MARIEEKILGIVRPYADKQGVKLFSAEDDIKRIGRALDKGETTVERAVADIDRACERRDCFLERSDREEIAKQLKRLM